MLDEFPIRVYPYRVYYADTDAGGVVYYAQYLRMFEQARTLYLEDSGISLSGLAAQNCLFVCRRAEVDYLSPARLGDVLNVSTGIAEMGRAYMTFAYRIVCENRKDGEGNTLRVAEGLTQMAAVREKDGVAFPIRVPRAIVEALPQDIRDQAVK